MALIPTSRLCMQFAQAIAEPEFDPNLVTHYEWDPDGGNFVIFSNPLFTLRALNGHDEIVTSYSAGTTFEYDQPSGLTISPLGWSGGELLVNISPDEFNTYNVHAFQTDTPSVGATMEFVCDH